jgi:hypothetical protein
MHINLDITAHHVSKGLHKKNLEEAAGGVRHFSNNKFTSLDSTDVSIE